MSKKLKDPIPLLIYDLVKLSVIDVSDKRHALILFIFNSMDGVQEVESVVCTKSELEASFLVLSKESSGQGFSLSLYLKDRNMSYTLADNLASLNEYGEIDEAATCFQCSRLISEWSKYVRDFLFIHPISMADDPEESVNDESDDFLLSDGLSDDLSGDLSDGLSDDLSGDLSDSLSDDSSGDLSDDAQQVDCGIKQRHGCTFCISPTSVGFGFVVIAMALFLLFIVLFFYTIKTQNDFNANWRALLSAKSTTQDINLNKNLTASDQYIDNYFYVPPKNAEEVDQPVITSTVETIGSKGYLQDKSGEIQAAIDKHFKESYKDEQLGRCGALDDDCEAEAVALKSDAILDGKTIDLLLKMAAFYALPIGDLHKEGSRPYLVFATVDDQRWLEELKATEQLGYTAMFFPVMESGEKSDEEIANELERLSLAYCLRDVAYASGDVLSERNDAELDVYRNSPIVQSCKWEDALLAANDLWQLLQAELEDLKITPQTPIIVNLNGEIISKEGLKEANAASLANWLN